MDLFAGKILRAYTTSHELLVSSGEGIDTRSRTAPGKCSLALPHHTHDIHSLHSKVGHVQSAQVGLSNLHV